MQTESTRLLCKVGSFIRQQMWSVLGAGLTKIVAHRDEQGVLFSAVCSHPKCIVGETTPKKRGAALVTSRFDWLGGVVNGPAAN